MARRKSYFTKSGKANPGGVFLNNMIADSQRRSRENKKAAASETKKV